VVAYLNSLEVVMIAWFHDIADQEIIAKEFEFLVKPLERVAALEIFRTAVGRESFIGIDEFVSFLRRRDKERERQSGTGIKLLASDPGK
jgi:hypothetical protein